MPIKLITSGGGSAIITPTSKATDYTLTVPAVTANVITSADSNTVIQSMINRSSFYGGYGPVFSAYQSVAQSVSATTWTKVSLQTVEYDSHSFFDATTNYRFTPTIAGYYAFFGSTAVASSVGNNGSALYKNGVSQRINYIASSANITPVGGGLQYANGTTDYFELYLYFQYSQNTQPGVNYTSFSGFLVRPA